MAKKQARASVREGLSRLKPERFRKETAEKSKGFGQLAARSRGAFGKVASRGGEAMGQLRERLPSGSELKERVSKAREWTADQLSEHTVGVGIAAAAVGLAGASLLPVSERERRMLSSASGRVQQLAQSIGENAGVVKLVESVGDLIERARGGEPEGAAEGEEPEEEVAENPEEVEEPPRAARPKGKSAKAEKKRAQREGRKAVPREAAASRTARAPSGGRRTSRARQ